MCPCRSRPSAETNSPQSGSQPPTTWSARFPIFARRTSPAPARRSSRCAAFRSRITALTSKARSRPISTRSTRAASRCSRPSCPSTPAPRRRDCPAHRRALRRVSRRASWSRPAASARLRSSGCRSASARQHWRERCRGSGSRSASPWRSPERSQSPAGPCGSQPELGRELRARGARPRCCPHSPATSFMRGPRGWDTFVPPLPSAQP